MSRTFQSVTGSEFQDVVAAYPFTRRVTEVHLHHTWRPRQQDYRGLATLEGMWRFHTQTHGWSDIAQHVTIAPDGTIWLCRNFNWSPASARGFNGNRKAGPFMIELIGDFDIGKETITDPQMEAMLTVIKTIQDHFKLHPSQLRFHNEMSGKTCPGTGFDKAQLIRDIEGHALEGSTASRGGDTPFPERAGRAFELMRGLNPYARQTDEMDEAEHAVGYEALEQASRSRLFGPELTDEMINALTDYVVNLEWGQFSDSGRIGTTPGDVDRLFEEAIPAEIEAAKARQEKARLLFYAHGGLVSEENALLGAFSQLKFWRRNNVYPIFFIWETGFAETIRQLISAAVDRTRARARISWATDNIIEEVVRALGSPRVWGGMKASALLASEPDGGAAYVAQKAADLLQKHGDDIEFHTVGHSAGSIFHAHFMAALVNRGARLKTAHYLAPAIRSDLFHKIVAPHLGNSIGPLTVFTMTKQLERDDTVTPLYRKSLLYLIYEALEEKRQTDILGLEISLRADDKAREIFGLRGTPSDRGEVVWSPSSNADSGSASQSSIHSGFDEDKATMESIARRVLNRREGQPIAPFEPSRSRAAVDFWQDQIDWPEPLEALMSNGAAAAPAPAGVAPTVIVPPAVQPGHRPSTGRKLALCVGIDQYPRSPLSGCVADARLWERTLSNLGFTTSRLLDQEATAETIRTQLRTLVQNSSPGNVLVFQFAGHGTWIEDISGDEGDGDTPDGDECLCAVDCESGEDGLIIDDQLRVILNDLPSGVAMTCFFDCCHSGTATRALLRPFRTGARGGETRPRYLAPSAAMKQAFKNLKNRAARQGAMGTNTMREVLFSACRSGELAYESNGQGDFTARAAQVLANGIGSLTNRGFHDQVLEKFGQAPRQHPELDCQPERLSAPLLNL
ncbi:Peptidase C14, caspase catalytic subunit p20 [Nitrosococcus oceani ATCC 19707]|uniref:Peptidase C14, caspase catalytic subunit p20 n=2 Tax=Nitrosococcus oceani TaxID=1229 RepID=Q3J9Z6_NITOC|nr:caspase family protein [Nitrosococcus oceani]ABA58350.1 Peptidase C14, caspase catalytic subunit p20 [Nitrosococcus oceani ATCC 19707]EDZ68533.1 caspase domain protein [Nitrosococcus oceani AFC27]KFI19280.1 peptidase C14 [Nitrosococcus oceani C-27]GEM18739.1 peptidase C14 [Nitrosococcus oceani]